MGHDINNMDQIALGYLELARDKSRDLDQVEYLDKSIEVLQRSTHLIKNVRKLQMLQETVLETRLVDVCAVLTDVGREFGAVPDKPLTLNLNGHQHCCVQANELLYDVFSNLVTNAIKHTGSHAEIILDLDVVNSEGSRYCRVMVEDDGPGIPDDFKPKVFNRMLRGTTTAKGTGIGLYLVKYLVDDYHGKIWVEDRVLNDNTSGTRFVVILPMAGNEALPEV
jgi:signal transduction histidine kinase